MKFHLVTGENTVLINDYLNQLILSFKPLPIKKINEKAPLSDLLTKLQTYDMFAQESLYIIKHPQWLGKIDKKSKSSLEDCLKLAETFNLPIIFIMKKIDKRSIGYKTLKSFSIIEKDFPEFKEWETSKVSDWIQSYCKKQGIIIKPLATRHFIETYGVNTPLIKQDIDKCIITIHPETTISEKNIVFLSGNTSGAYLNLSEAVKNGKIDVIIQQIDQLIELKEDPHKIFNQLLFQFNQLLPLIFGLNNQLSEDLIAKKLGKHPFYIKKLIESIRKNPLKDNIPDLYIKFAKIDQHIKSGILSSKQGLLSFCATIKHQY